MEVNGKFEKTALFMPPHDLRQHPISEHEFLENLTKKYHTCFSSQEESPTLIEKIRSKLHV